MFHCVKSIHNYTHTDVSETPLPPSYKNGILAYCWNDISNVKKTSQKCRNNITRCRECVWLVAGVKQTHLARVRLIGLWGWVGLHTCGALSNQAHPHTHSGLSPDMSASPPAHQTIHAVHLGNKPDLPSTCVLSCWGSPEPATFGGLWFHLVAGSKGLCYTCIGNYDARMWKLSQIWYFRKHNDHFNRDRKLSASIHFGSK